MKKMSHKQKMTFLKKGLLEWLEDCLKDEKEDETIQLYVGLKTKILERDLEEVEDYLNLIYESGLGAGFNCEDSVWNFLHGVILEQIFED